MPDLGKSVTCSLFFFEETPFSIWCQQSQGMENQALVFKRRPKHFSLRLCANRQSSNRYSGDSFLDSGVYIKLCYVDSSYSTPPLSCSWLHKAEAIIASILCDASSWQENVGLYYCHPCLLFYIVSRYNKNECHYSEGYRKRCKGSKTIA